MIAQGKWRGNDIELSLSHGAWVYCDTMQAVAGSKRPCGHCNQYPTPSGHDACLGEIPGVVNACCGHGVVEDSYIQMNDGAMLRGQAAQEFMQANPSQRKSEMTAHDNLEQ